MTADKLRIAVSHCLASSYAAQNPLAAVAAFVAELRADPDWTDEEVSVVETSALRILTAIVAPREPA